MSEKDELTEQERFLLENIASILARLASMEAIVSLAKLDIDDPLSSQMLEVKKLQQRLKGIYFSNN